VECLNLNASLNFLNGFVIFQLFELITFEKESTDSQQGYGSFTRHAVKGWRYYGSPGVDGELFPKNTEFPTTDTNSIYTLLVAKNRNGTDSIAWRSMGIIDKKSQLQGYNKSNASVATPSLNTPKVATPSLSKTNDAYAEQKAKILTNLEQEQHQLRSKIEKVNNMMKILDLRDFVDKYPQYDITPLFREFYLNKIEEIKKQTNTSSSNSSVASTTVSAGGSRRQRKPRRRVTHRRRSTLKKNRR
jgi:hypothetical protein